MVKTVKLLDYFGGNCVIDSVGEPTAVYKKDRREGERGEEFMFSLVYRVIIIIVFSPINFLPELLALFCFLCDFLLELVSIWYQSLIPRP